MVAVNIKAAAAGIYPYRQPGNIGPKKTDLFDTAENGREY